MSSMEQQKLLLAAAGNYPKIRLFTAAKRESSTPIEELLRISLQWSVASSTSVGNGPASAVCWLYGRMIHAGLKMEDPLDLFIHHGVELLLNYGCQDKL
jgi:hypothetical protein